MNIKDKIEKLLRASSSPNEHEAQVALRLAQELMAKYKLSMSDLQEESKSRKIIHKEHIKAIGVAIHNFWTMCEDLFGKIHFEEI